MVCKEILNAATLLYERGYMTETEFFSVVKRIERMEKHRAKVLEAVAIAMEVLHFVRQDRGVDGNE